LARPRGFQKPKRALDGESGTIYRIVEERAAWWVPKAVDRRIAGAIVGGFLGSFIGLGKVESFDLGGIFIATIGAIILLIVYRLVRKRS